jgi:acyl dehydratase
VDDGTRWLGHRTVTADAVASFGQITGDYSRIHFDHELGKASPHGRGFAHGLLGASWALGMLALHAPHRLGCGDPRARPGGFRVRFDGVVRFGDTLALRWEDTAPDEPVSGCEQRCTAFALGDAGARTVASGAVEVRLTDSDAVPHQATGEAPWPGGAWVPPESPAVWAAEDVVERGPRGASPVRTVTEADVVRYCTFTGELDPAYLDASFAAGTRWGARIAPPMLCFCLAFSVWLRELLRLPMGGDESSAGHLGDRWQFVAPVRLGDTLEVRHRPLGLRRTRSQPARGVATFGLQLVNQREEIVQRGEVDMMLSMREPEEERA